MKNATETCWRYQCFNAAKYHETTEAWETATGYDYYMYNGANRPVTRERPYCGTHAPSRIAARRAAPRQRAELEAGQ